MPDPSDSERYEPSNRCTELQADNIIDRLNQLAKRGVKYPWPYTLVLAIEDKT
jgi:hypothetical protein